jgi:hypothetical protein
MAIAIRITIRVVSTFQKRGDVDLLSVMWDRFLEYGLNH